MGVYERRMGGRQGGKAYKVRYLVSIIFPCSHQHASEATAALPTCSSPRTPMAEVTVPTFTVRNLTVF
ncbi:hypothetical protein E2C01_102063 [Portunus trituberculatus]|uniref:Uncharacterized protein n=1 Tax=Portunus trituberculatus TaxID=210409 RepID=A0A5B7KLV8_PORTR|nr:hypothetical protein [Portunus trituberculatus]